MQLLKTSFLLLFIGFQISNAQTKSNLKTVHIEEFNWTAAVPESLTPVKQEEWGKMMKKNVDFLGEEVLNQEVTIFSYKNQSNRFEAVWQPYDAEICGDYQELNAEANEVMHQIYESQLPQAYFDSVTTTQRISDFEFKRFDVKIEVPEVITMKIIRFYRLFGNRQFNMYITVIDEKLGQKMLDAFLQSKFE